MAAAIPLIIISGYFVQYITTFLSIVLHELVHIVVASLKGSRIVWVKLMPVGLSAGVDTGNCSRNDRLAIYSSGPLMNIIISAATYSAGFFIPDEQGFFYYISIVNFYLAVFNLIPAIPLDGGKILQEILDDSLGLILSAKYIRMLALLSSIIITAAGIYQNMSGKLNLSLFIIGLYLIITFNTRKLEASLMNIKQLLYRRQKLISKGIYQARELVVLKGMRLSAVIKALDYDRFHIIYILDDNLTLLHMITENEIIECMLKHPDATFDELLKIL